MLRGDGRAVSLASTRRRAGALSPVRAVGADDNGAGGRGFLDGYRADLVAVRNFREFKRVLERAYEYDANIEAQLDRFVNEGGARDKTDDLSGR